MEAQHSGLATKVHKHPVPAGAPAGFRKRRAAARCRPQRPDGLLAGIPGREPRNGTAAPVAVPQLPYTETLARTWKGSLCAHALLCLMCARRSAPESLA